MAAALVHVLVAGEGKHRMVTGLGSWLLQQRGCQSRGSVALVGSHRRPGFVCVATWPGCPLPVCSEPLPSHGLAWFLFPPRQQPRWCRELRPWRGRHRGQGRRLGGGDTERAMALGRGGRPGRGHNHARIQARHVCTCYHGLRSGGVLLSSGSQPGEVASARGTRCHQNEVGGKQGHVRRRGKPGGVSSP